MDIVTLGAALNGSAEYVNSHFKGGSNIQIVDNPDGTQTINASGEVSAEDTVARADIAAIKDGTNIDSFGDVETALDDKADSLTTYTKTEVDTALSAKANSADVYSKTAVDTALGNKADKSTTYTKTEVDTALGSKQDTISDLSTIRSGAALGATAVQPETGKGLSTNDYTTAEKTKLAGIEAQANKTTVDDALSGSSTNPVQNKVVKTALDLKADATDIPTVNNATITIQKNGTKVSDFTVNASSNKTINITVPTTASDVNALPSSTKYAGAATAGGSATSAAKLDTASAGSVTQPVYFTNGVPTPTTYSLEKSVPSDAVFTDTTYSNMSQSEATTGTATNGRLISAKVLGDTIDEKIAKLGYSTETVTFSSLPTGTSWVKTSGGLFYTSPTIDVSDKFDVIYSATLNDFGNIQGNIVVVPYIKPGTAKFGLWVVDPTNPQTLPMVSGTMVKVALFGVLK